MPDMQEGAEHMGSVKMRGRMGQLETAVTHPFPGQREKQLNTSLLYLVLTCFSHLQVLDKQTREIQTRQFTYGY